MVLLLGATLRAKPRVLSLRAACLASELDPLPEKLRSIGRLDGLVALPLVRKEVALPALFIRLRGLDLRYAPRQLLILLPHLINVLLHLVVLTLEPSDVLVVVLSLEVELTVLLLVLVDLLHRFLVLELLAFDAVQLLRLQLLQHVELAVDINLLFLKLFSFQKIFNRYCSISSIFDRPHN